MSSLFDPFWLSVWPPACYGPLDVVAIAPTFEYGAGTWTVRPSPTQFGFPPIQRKASGPQSSLKQLPWTLTDTSRGLRMNMSIQIYLYLFVYYLLLLFIIHILWCIHSCWKIAALAAVEMIIAQTSLKQRHFSKACFCSSLYDSNHLPSLHLFVVQQCSVYVCSPRLRDATQYFTHKRQMDLLNRSQEESLICSHGYEQFRIG